jgi:hypothetical protein
MAFFIVIIGLLQVLAGIGAFIGSKSAIHEILGSISFGMGVLSIAMGIAVNHLGAIRDALTRRDG